MPDLQSLFQEGLAAYERKQYDEAKQAFQTCIDQNPLMSEAYLNLGNVYFKQDNLTDAKTQWDKAISVNPLEIKAYLNLGNAFFQEENYSRAIFYWNIFKQLDPYDERVHLNLGLAYEELREIKMAFQSYSLFLNMTKSLDTEGLRVRRRMEDSTEIAQHNLGIAERAILKGQLEHACNVYAENICLIPLNVKVYKHYAAALFKTGQYQEAAFWYDKAFSMKEPEMSALINLGVTSEKIGDTLTTMWSFGMVSRLWPDSSPKQVRDKFQTLMENGPSFFAKSIKECEHALEEKAYDVADKQLSKLFDIAFYCAQNQLAEIKGLQMKIELIRDPGRRAVELTYSRAKTFFEKNQYELALSQYESYLEMAPEGEHAPEAVEKCEEIRLKISIPALESSASKGR